MTAMTDHPLIRQQAFECDGPVEVDIELGGGSVDLRFTDADTTDEPGSAQVGTGAGTETSPDTSSADTEVPAEPPTPDVNDSQTPDKPPTTQSMIMVEIRAEPRRGEQWGLPGLLSWVSSQLGTGQSPFGGRLDELAEQAVRETSITVLGNRLSIRAPRTMPLRAVALSVVVHAPAGSSLDAKCGSADVRVAGIAGRVQIDTGSGDVSVDHAAGQACVKTGSGDLRLGPMLDGLTARSSSGDIEVASIAGDAAVHSGSGDIRLGTVLGDRVKARTGSGNLTVATAGAGRLELTTGSGDLWIGIRPGVVAEIDLTSGSGRTRSELPVSDSPPADDAATLHVQARTGSGEAVVAAATA